MEINKVSFDTTNPYKYQSKVSKKLEVSDNIKLSPISKGLNLIIKNGLTGEECSEANIMRGREIIKNWSKPDNNKVDQLMFKMWNEI